MKKLYYFLLVCGCLAAGAPLHAQLVCNQDLQVSLDDNCQVTLRPDDLLEGYNGNDADYRIEILNGSNQVVGDSTVNGTFVGELLTARIFELATGNSCWSTFLVEDKQGPVCADATLDANCQTDLTALAAPAFVDNCDANPVVTLVEEVTLDDEICDGEAVRLRRYVAYDAQGNASEVCTQTIRISRVAPVFPVDVTFGCAQLAANPQITAATALNPNLLTGPAVNGDTGIEVFDVPGSTALAATGAGLPNVFDSPLCNYAVTFSEELLGVCDGITAARKIVRSFVVLDWCTSTVMTTDAAGNTATQVIRVVDRTAPVVTAVPLVLPANVPGEHPQGCRSTAFVPAPQVQEDCSDFTVRIFSNLGELDYANGVNGNAGGTIPAPGLPVGTSILAYQVTDACGNTSELFTQVTIADTESPTVICDAITSVSLDDNGQAVVAADVFDDGTYDNCCLDRLEVRRTSDACGVAGNTTFGESVAFCCSDATGGPVAVQLRAYDCAGNFNDCMVLIEVEDKVLPAVTCLPGATIDCADFNANLLVGLNDGDGSVLDVFGLPQFTDNCGILVDTTVSLALGSCNEGTIVRTFIGTTADGTVLLCNQEITIVSVSDFVVSFPADEEVFCETPDDMNFPGPVVLFDDCELVGVSSVDEVSSQVPGACFKIIRTWEVINWCVTGDEVDQEAVEASEAELVAVLGGPQSAAPNCDLDGDGDCDTRTFRDSWTLSAQPGASAAGTDGAPDTDPDANPWDGFIRYQQVITVTDNAVPDIDEPADLTLCIDGPGCTRDVVLVTPDIKDCSPEITVEITGDLASDEGTVSDVGPGVYTVIFTAFDNCGNSTFRDQVITVEDCKNPSIICLDGINVALGTDGAAELWASDLVKEGFDNCTDSTDLIFSFGADTTTTSLALNCTTQNTFQVEIYVTDEAGNQEFCTTEINVQDNDLVCPGALVVLDGQTRTATGEAVAGVEISLSNGTWPALTDTNGNYHFDLSEGEDYTVVPRRDDHLTNGVTTFDLVLISKHILGTQALEHTAQLIAADANASASITTLDIVAIRKVILFVADEFPNNTSWRFVAADFTFPDPTNPWTAPFPELVNFNNIAAGDWRADFTAIKVGDVNGNAAPQLTAAADAVSRHAAPWTLHADDRYLRAGEPFELVLAGAELQACQFTLGFDARRLAVDPATASGDWCAEHLGAPAPGILTASWNGATATAPVLRLAGTALQDGYLSEALQLRRGYTPAAAYDADGTVRPLHFQFGAAPAAPVAVRFGSQPNPFRTHTQLTVELPRADRVQLTVYDATGRTLWDHRADYAAGTHQVRFDRPAGQGAGVLLCRLQTTAGVQTQRLVVE